MTVSDDGAQLIVGTKQSDLILEERGKCTLLVGGHAQGELWALACSPKACLFATGGDDVLLRLLPLRDCLIYVIMS